MLHKTLPIKSWRYINDGHPAPLSFHLFFLSAPVFRTDAIPSDSFIPPAFIVDDVLALTFAHRVMVVAGTLKRLVMPVDRDRFIIIGVPSDPFVTPAEADEPEAFYR